MNSSAVSRHIASRLRELLPEDLRALYTIDTEVEPLRARNEDSIECAVTGATEIIPGNATYRVSVTVKLVADVTRFGGLSSSSIPQAITAHINAIGACLVELQRAHYVFADDGSCMLIALTVDPPLIGVLETAYTASWSLSVIAQF